MDLDINNHVNSNSAQNILEQILDLPQSRMIQYVPNVSFESVPVGDLMYHQQVQTTIKHQCTIVRRLPVIRSLNKCVYITVMVRFLAIGNMVFVGGEVYLNAPDEAELASLKARSDVERLPLLIKFPGMWHCYKDSGVTLEYKEHTHYYKDTDTLVSQPKCDQSLTSAHNTAGAVVNAIISRFASPDAACLLTSGSRLFRFHQSAAVATKGQKSGLEINQVGGAYVMPFGLKENEYHYHISLAYAHFAPSLVDLANIIGAQCVVYLACQTARLLDYFEGECVIPYTLERSQHSPRVGVIEGKLKSVCKAISDALPLRMAYSRGHHVTFESPPKPMKRICVSATDVRSLGAEVYEIGTPAYSNEVLLP